MEKLCRSTPCLFNAEEKEQLQRFIRGKGDLACLVSVTGGLDADMLPGRPGVISCVRDGKAWTCPVRLIDELPIDMWGLPASRAAAVASHDHLTEEEAALLCRSIISSASATPAHPRNFPGGRTMRDGERRQYQSIGSHTKVADFLRDSPAAELTDDALDVFSVQDLKDFLASEVRSRTPENLSRGVVLLPAGPQV